MFITHLFSTQWRYERDLILFTAWFKFGIGKARAATVPHFRSHSVYCFLCMICECYDLPIYTTRIWTVYQFFDIDYSTKQRGIDLGQWGLSLNIKIDIRLPRMLKHLPSTCRRMHVLTYIMSGESQEFQIGLQLLDHSYSIHEFVFYFYFVDHFYIMIY